MIDNPVPHPVMPVPPVDGFILQLLTAHAYSAYMRQRREPRVQSGEETYHHRDLKAALLSAGMRTLEAGKPLSLRRISREVGVSPAAPYRHFTDRDALESALAVQGFHDLLRDLTEGRATPASPEVISDIIVAYVEFALSRPALFRLMFNSPPVDVNGDRAQASARIYHLLKEAMARAFSEEDAESLASAGWALAHGLADLHLEGHLPAGSRDEVCERVHRASTLTLASIARSD